MRACEPEPEPEPEPRAYFASHCVFSGFFFFFFKFNVNILLSKCYTWLKKQNFPIFFRALISAQVVFLSVSNLISSNGFRRSVYSFRYNLRWLKTDFCFSKTYRTRCNFSGLEVFCCKWLFYFFKITLHCSFHGVLVIN